MNSTILVPIAGEGSRFARSEWIVPKPLILIDNKRIIEWTMDSIDISNSNLIFIVRKEHVEEFSIDSYLKEKFGKDTKIVIANEPTDGSVCSCLLARDLIDNDKPLAIHCSDVFFEPKFSFENINSDKNWDGCILTFKSNSINYSYSSTDSEGYVKEVAEKKVISDQASAGIYVFKKGRDFVKAADEMIQNNLRTKNEFYLAPIYNILVKNGLKVVTEEVDKISIFGTPEEYKFFTKNTLPLINKKQVAICSDHSGAKNKESLKNILDSMSIPYIDFGTYNSKDTDYHPYVASAAKSVLNGTCSFGIGFCRSGQAINITANKIKGIRSAWVNDSWMAEMAIRHNCANFLAISEKMVDEKQLKNIIKTYWDHTFDGGRHQNRLMRL